MGALKRFYEDCATSGRCPISSETWAYLDDLEQADTSIDWIGYTEHEYTGHDGRQYLEDCITMKSARRLVAEGLANDEIEGFVEFFGDYLDLGVCDECGQLEQITLRTRHGEMFCAECQ